PLYAHVPGFERIVEFANDKKNPPDTNAWHSDLSFKPDPPFASILVAREVPRSGGDTLWANMYAAYEALPATVKQQIEGLRALHHMGDFMTPFDAPDSNSTQRLKEAMQRFGCAVHPLVRTHPVTGRRYLYVNDSFTAHIVGLTTQESRRLL